jgi:preprotein translocase subunit Sec63
MDKPHYINPLAQVIIERLQAAFLKSGSTSEFYELLEVPKNANAEKIRSQYRKKALQYHPDKIQQKYHRPATDDEKAMRVLSSLPHQRAKKR